MIERNLRRMLADLRRQFGENAYDIERAKARLEELQQERTRVIDVIRNIEMELKRLEGAEREIE